VFEDGWTVGAFWQPDGLGFPPKLTLVGGNAGRDLTEDRRIPGKQRQVAVRRGGGRDLDPAGILQAAQGADDVAAKAAREPGRGAGEPVVKEPGETAHPRTARLFKAIDVVRRPGGALRREVDEVIDDQGIGQLLGKDRGDTDRQTVLDALFLQIE